MWKYSAQVEPRDRWAIAAYIRVLQASQNSNLSDLSAEQRSKLPADAEQAVASAIAPAPAATAGPATKTGATK
jgi:hypothetical protein